MTANWKQLFAYYFVYGSCKAETVKKMIFEVLSKLEDMGINVVAAISDQRRNFMKLDSLLGNS